MTKGILLLALSDWHYGKMAAGLAATLKACDSGVSITLVHNSDVIKELSEKEKSCFDKLIKIDEVKPIRAKLTIYDLSPYDETLYLDVDMAWFDRSPLQIFEACKDYEFCMKNYSSEPLNKVANDPKAWANFGDIALSYKLSEENYYHLSSEVIYFKKTKAVKKLFTTALKIYDKPKITHRDFGGEMPDELAFSIAMMQNQFYPGIDKWEPVIWEQSNKAKFNPENLRSLFYGLSMGGIKATNSAISFYNNLIAAAYYKLGISTPYKWENKYRFLNKRKSNGY